MLAATGLALVLALGACGGNDSSNEQVAVVGDAEIQRGEVDERVDALRRAQRDAASERFGGADPATADSGSPSQPSVSSRKALEQQAIAQLMVDAAIEQEAKRRGIEVTDAEVKARWDMSVGKQFRNEKALRKFLGGQTEEEALHQLRLQLLNQRIFDQVAEQAGGGKRGARAVKRFQRQFERRWRKQTKCSDSAARAAGLCSSGG